MTADITNIIAQVPETLEALTGVNLLRFRGHQIACRHFLGRRVRFNRLGLILNNRTLVRSLGLKRTCNIVP